jgi:hypothetical protein
MILIGFVNKKIAHCVTGRRTFPIADEGKPPFSFGKRRRIKQKQIQKSKTMHAKTQNE